MRVFSMSTFPQPHVILIREISGNGIVNSLQLHKNNYLFMSHNDNGSNYKIITPVKSNKGKFIHITNLN